MTATFLSEDDIYRTSSQYRLWSFSPERLAAQRKRTHELAIERIEAQNVSDDDKSRAQYLTQEEELSLVQRYCEQIRATNDHFKWPVSVKATAVQYLRRFYLSNSVMTYPPKEIYKTALFLACKTEATHMTLSEYARRISSKPEEILAPEYKLMQALRFTLDIRQPFRGLKGVLMELLNMAEGLPQPELREFLLAVRSSRTGVRGEMQPQERVQTAYATARSILDNQALMTDVYFLYTPAQILHAALYMADAELSDFYLSTKLPTEDPIRSRVMTAVRACAEMLSSFTKASILSKDERAALEAKLEQCRDQSTKNIVDAHQAKKSGMSVKDLQNVKQRQTVVQVGDDPFGPSLQSNGTSKERG